MIFAGVFRNYTCNCAFGWTGEHCELQIDPCSNQTLNNCDKDFAFCIHTGPGAYDCSCFPGYTTENAGFNCTELDECGSAPCQHGASCTDHLIGYDCACVAGYTSADSRSPTTSRYMTPGVEESKYVVWGTPEGNCEVDIDECESSPCVNGAACTDSNDVNGVTGGPTSSDAYTCAVSRWLAAAISAEHRCCSWDLTKAPLFLQCIVGWSNGRCDYEYISQYAEQCTVLESSSVLAAVVEAEAARAQAVAEVAAAEEAAEAAEAAVVEATANLTAAAETENVTLVLDAEAVVAEVTASWAVANDSIAMLAVAGRADVAVAAGVAAAVLDGNCDIPVDECKSSPCSPRTTEPVWLSLCLSPLRSPLSPLRSRLSSLASPLSPLFSRLSNLLSLPKQVLRPRLQSRDTSCCSRPR